MNTYVLLYCCTGAERDGIPPQTASGKEGGFVAVCEKCGKDVGYSGKTIRGDCYCGQCARSVPTCDKCKWHYNSEVHPRYGCCAHFNQYLQDFENICGAYEEGRQVHPDVYV